MRRFLALLALALPLQAARAQSVTLDNATLSVTAGTVDLGTGTLFVGSNGTLDENGGRVTTTDPGTLTTQPPRPFATAASADNVAGLGFTITTDVAPGDVTVTRGHSIQSGNGNSSIARYFDVAATTNTGLNATIVFHYDDAELNGLTEADLVLFHSTDGGTTWTMAGGTVDEANNTITLTGVDGFARWTAGSTATPLPVELTAFTATADGADVALHWQTASEANNAGFDVEQRVVAGDTTWQRLAFVAGAGTTTRPQAYTYRAAALAPGRHAFRLRQVDYDGGAAYSQQVEVTVGLPEAFVLEPAYPNPFNPATTVRFAVREAQPVTVVLHDVLGRSVRVLYQGTPAASTSQALHVEAADLPSGTYFVRLSGDGIDAVQPILLVK